VIKLVPFGQASNLGANLGDTVVGINGKWMDGYDAVMDVIKKIQYPAEFVLRRETFSSPTDTSNNQVLVLRMISFVCSSNN
jgi:hypothetical protein